MPNEVILYDASTRQWLHFRQPIAVLQTQQIQDVLPILEQVGRATEEGLWAAGFLSYEAAPAFDPAFRVRPAGGLPLAWFGLFRAAETYEPETRPGEAYHLGAWQPSVERDEYEQAIADIKECIGRGDTYQVNYTLRLRANFSGDPWGLLQTLRQAQPADYAAYVDAGRFVLCSASPELFFIRQGERLIGKPMKGTAGRGRTLAEDQAQADWLYHSEKNRAENVMIVDMVRNDLGRIAQTGSVQVTRLFELERYPTVWQMTSTVEANSPAGLAEVMRALFPCASITGAPKIRTMQIIARLENEPRGAYTGCIGFVAPGTGVLGTGVLGTGVLGTGAQGRAQFNVAIRTVQVDRQAGEAVYGVGGGIVWDSTSAEEYQEWKIKARLLTQPRPVFDLLESLLWTPEEGLTLLEYHLRRLGESAAYFGYPFNRARVEEQLHQAAEGCKVSQAGKEAHKLRLTLDRMGHVKIQATALAQIPLPDPARLQRAAEPVSSSNPFLFHKTTHREVYIQARAGLPAWPEGVEALLWNERREVTESENANLVARVDGEMVTPPVTCGLLPGTFRAWLLQSGQVQERILQVEDLPGCEALYLVNSVRGWRKAILLSA